MTLPLLPVVRRATMLAGGLAAAASAPAQVTAWDFTSGAQGWRVNDLAGVGDYTTSYGTYPVTHHATGGVAGGYISAFDPSNGTYMFEAPSADLGDYSAFLGGTLAFSLRTDYQDWTIDPVLVLRSGALGFNLVHTFSPLPGADWTDYRVTLAAGSFRRDSSSGALLTDAEFSTALAAVSHLFISAEYGNGLKETTGLDQVAFAAVPEPATWAAWLGLAALVAAGRQRRG